MTGLIYVQVSFKTGLTVLSSNRSAGLQMYAVGHQAVYFAWNSMYVGFTANFSYQFPRHHYFVTL